MCALHTSLEKVSKHPSSKHGQTKIHVCLGHVLWFWFFKNAGPGHCSSMNGSCLFFQVDVSLKWQAQLFFLRHRSSCAEINPMRLLEPESNAESWREPKKGSLDQKFETSESLGLPRKSKEKTKNHHKIPKNHTYRSAKATNHGSFGGGGGLRIESSFLSFEPRLGLSKSRIQKTLYVAPFQLFLPVFALLLGGVLVVLRWCWGGF